METGRRNTLVRMTALRLAIASAAVAAAVAAATASGTGAASCRPWQAHVSQGAVQLVDYNTAQPTGGPLAGTVLPQSGNMFKAAGRVVVAMGGVHFSIRPQTYFTLGCSSQTKGSPPVPTLSLGAGAITVADPHGIAGAVWDFEALAGPVPGRPDAITFTVTRKPAAPPTIPTMIAALGDQYDAVRATTTVAAAGEAPVNVTPYVGPQPGHCRHCPHAVLSSVGARSAPGKRMSGGSASYTP